MSGARLEVTDVCTGCGACVRACPFSAITVVDGRALVGGACTLCGACVDVCPVGALVLHRPPPSRTEPGSYRDVWALAEIAGDGTLRAVSLELLTKGRELADALGERLHSVVLGHGVEPHVGTLAGHGADVVHLVDHPELATYDTDVFSTVLVGLVGRYHPSVLLVPATPLGRDLAPRVATVLGVGLTADCTDLSIRDGMLLQTRPAFGGNIMVDIVTPDHRPQMATVRPNVFSVAEPVPGRGAEVVREEVTIPPGLRRAHVIERAVAAVGSALALEEADIIVSGGRGACRDGALDLIAELADALGAALGCSRAVVEMGMMPKVHQVGQSGRTVSPRLYIAAGISGAIQHLVGMRASHVIIAINTDPDAPIMEAADYAVVGDLFEIVPRLTEAIRRLRGGGEE